MCVCVMSVCVMSVCVKGERERGRALKPQFILIILILWLPSIRTTSHTSTCRHTSLAWICSMQLYIYMMHTCSLE